MSSFTAFSHLPARPMRSSGNGLTQLLHLGYRLSAALVVCVLALTGVSAGPAAALSTLPARASATPLRSGVPVHGAVTGPAGVSYTFSAVAGKHFTLAITNPHTSSGQRLQMNVVNPSGGQDGAAVQFSTDPTSKDLTPDVNSAGTTTVVISPYDAGATGTFTLTYATDITGVLTSGHGVTPTIAYFGQQALYSFTGVAGKHVTVAITNPRISTGNRFRMIVSNSSGGQLGSTAYFSTAPTSVDFTVDNVSAGTIYVSVYQYDYGTTGSFTLTYANDVTGVLTSGTPVSPQITYFGQQALYTFTAVAGKHVTVAITNPRISTGNRFRMIVSNSSGAQIGSTAYFSTGPTSIDFTPDTTSAGTISVSVYQYDYGTTGSFTLTYANDVTGVLTSGNSVTPTIAYVGQQALYTSTSKANKAVTLTVSKPHIATGSRFRMIALDGSGGQLGSTAYFSTSSAVLTFTPDSSSAGAFSVSIYQYDYGTTGSFTLTCKGCFSPPVPVVTGVAPASGPVGGGALVIISGAGFTGTSSVTFGTVAARSFSVLNDATIAAISPDEAAGRYDIRVTNGNGTSASVGADTFRVIAPRPAVDGVSPRTGPVAGGTTVTITGSGFTGATSVSFGAAKGTGVTILNDDTLTVTSPPQSAGIYDVLVSTPAGVSVATSADRFTVT